MEVGFRLSQQRTKLAAGQVIFELNVPSGTVKFGKPAPELRKLLRRQRTDSVCDGLDVGHDGTGKCYEYAAA